MDLEYILDAAGKAPLAHRSNAAKEALQQCVIASLAEQGLLSDVAFIGGTALRILHRLPRYSEDLDFIWRNSSSTEALSKWGAGIKRAVSKLGLTPHLQSSGPTGINARVQKRSYAIHLAATSTAFARFAREGLQISFEIDLDPPAHVEPEMRRLNIGSSDVQVPTLDLPSLMAGKLHILLTRTDREKGRDWFDYLWYRKKGILPNVAQLKSAIEQTATGPEASYWMSYLRERSSSVRWEHVQNDVRSFLENQDDVRDLNSVSIDHLTPYPDFDAVAAELLEQPELDLSFRADHPLLKDLSRAASEGDESAIEARQALLPILRSALDPEAEFGGMSP